MLSPFKVPSSKYNVNFIPSITQVLLVMQHGKRHVEVQAEAQPSSAISKFFFFLLCLYLPALLSTKTVMP